MRIAHVNNYFLPRPTGSAHLTAGLAGALAGAGHEVLVVTASYMDAPTEEDLDGYRVVRLPSWNTPRSKFSMNYQLALCVSPSNVRRLWRALDDFAPDVIHVHGQFFDLSWMAGLWARRRKVPLVLTVHTALTHTNRAHASIMRLLDLAVVRPMMAMIRPTFVVIDKFIAGYVRSRYNPRPEQVEWLPLGIDIGRFESVPDATSLKRELGLSDRPVILSLGHVIPLRNRLLLVEALPAILREHPDVALLIVGNVNDTACLERAIELGVRDAIVTTGAVASDQVPSYVAIADVECHDHQGYGLGTASLEVMAGGVPVVAVVDLDNFPGLTLRPWIDVGIVDACASALAEGINRLLSDRALRERLGRTQREFVDAHFSLASVVRLHETLYGKLVP